VNHQLSVSSYSFRQQLGPVKLMFRGPDGKKAPFVWGEPPPQAMTLLELPALVRERLGLSAVEICQFHVSDASPAYVDRLKDALTSADVALVNMPIDVGNISDVNPAYREEDLAEIEGWMQVAATLGAHMVRVNASMPMAPEAAPIEVTIDSYRRLARAAELLGLQLLIENHGGITKDPEVIVQIVEAVGQPRLKTLVDIGNFEPLMSANLAEFQGKPRPAVDPTPVYAAIARIAPYAGLVHAKTRAFDSSGKSTDLDVVRALRVVRDAGFTGPISIEYEGSVGDPWENSLRTKALVEEAVG
jgi:sugar phosphate isomerase/epimerase